MPMDSPVQVQHIDLNRLSRDSARQALSQVADVHRACWPDKPIEKVYAERLDREAVNNELWLARGPDGRIVGFLHGIAEDLELDRTKVLLMRSLAAVYPEWRTVLAFERQGILPLMRWALRGRLRGRLPLLFAHFATPSTYRTILQVLPRVVPSPDTTPDQRLLRLRDAAIVHYGLVRVPGRAHACHGPRLAMSEGERAHWMAHSAPEVRFFVEECPGFADGEYLSGIVPMDWSDLARAPLHASVAIARKWHDRRGRNVIRGRSS